ncbi:MYND finger protein [Ceratobasidium theobromae]|uniref:MYND finger protein n=1 Tax=Ceratobasidium theobromae TaxID=1582974 RepID=A0A5N5QIH8_9AGAM|nr:MYND finger protein [Ceratobasidium theobromae]
MSQSDYLFYPIGNTPAISLTQDLSPEQSADIVLLGCGDPRNILFTLFSDLVVGTKTRQMDITCCDLEPAVLARNILLFALLEDNEPADAVWNIFYHFRIDNRSLDILIRHSRQLYDCSQTAESWRESRYGSFLKMVDSRTLTELSRLWKSYADFINLPASRLQQLLKEKERIAKMMPDDRGFNLSPSRSAGMLWHEAMIPVVELFQKYWKTGTTFSSDKDVQSATNLNPTFVYSSFGETFNPHYGTFPSGFHLMPAFAPIAKDPVGPLPNTGSATIDVCKQQFSAWCKSFRAARATKTITIRFFSGDALGFCRALNELALTGQSSTNIFVSAWRASQIDLDELNASVPQAPTTFDVIDTSNLTDHVGMINLLIVTQPLLKKDPQSQSIIYTESLHPSGEDVTRSFWERLGTDVPTISTLLGIAPRPYVSGFTTQSNAHELIYASGTSSQFHERIAWVDPTGGDHHACTTNTTVTFQAADLPHILYRIYQQMFYNETVTASLLNPSVAELRLRMKTHYQRETVALLFRTIQRRVCIDDGEWGQVTKAFLQIAINDKTRIIESNNYQDLCLQFQLYNVHASEWLQPDWHNKFRLNPQTKIFDGFSDVSPIVCVVLTVPRKKLEALFDDSETIGQPTFQCSLRVENSHDNTYSAIHAVWGKCSTSPGSDKVILEEDTQGARGLSDLVVFFWNSSWVLQIPDTLVCLGIKVNPLTSSMWRQKLGERLEFFSVQVTNRQYVQLLPYRPALASQMPQLPPNTTGKSLVKAPRSPWYCKVIADEKNRSAGSLCVRFDAESTAEQRALLEGAAVSTMQIAPCTMELAIGQHRHIVPYPYPVQGGSHRLRIARKSRYVEPFDQAGYFLNPFPVAHRNAYTPWNIHHLQLDRLPILRTKATDKWQWLNPLSGVQLSDRERAIRGSDPELAQAANVFVNVKETIHALLMNASGQQGIQQRALALGDPGNQGVYMILFVGGIRLDLASFTVVIDTAVVPLSNNRMPDLLPGIQELHNSENLAQVNTAGHEVAAWKKLIPACVERCRTWKHGANCEYRAQRKIPLSTAIDKNPICTCGQGIGFSALEWNVTEWKGLLPFATRAAISPIFAVSYIERVAGTVREQASTSKNSSSGQLQAGIAADKHAIAQLHASVKIGRGTRRTVRVETRS